MLVGDGAWVGFRHELARRTIESSLTASERLAADRTVMSALLHHPGVEPSRLVHHAQRSGRTDVILEHGPAAAHEAIRLGAHRQAAEVLRFVLDRRDLLEPHDAIELTVQRAYSLYLVNQFDAALECAESAVAAAGASDDAVLLADALLVLARVVFFARGPMRAREAAARAVEILEPVHDETRLAAGLTELARAHSNLVTVSIVADPCERAETAAQRAVAIAQRIGQPGIEAQALCYLGDARLAQAILAGTQIRCAPSRSRVPTSGGRRRCALRQRRTRRLPQRPSRRRRADGRGGPARGGRLRSSSRASIGSG